MDALSENADAHLDADLRRIRLVARVAACVWILAAAVLTLSISDRVLSAYLEDEADHATRDTVAIAGIVDRIVHELSAMPRVLAKSRELAAIVARYNARGEAFTGLTPEARSTALKNDADVSRVNQRLTAIRNDLSYDLVYVLDAQGIRIMSSDWDRPLTLLGVRLDDREYFKEAMASRGGQMFGVSRTTRNPALFFSAPIEDDGPTIGVVVVRLASSTIGAALAGSRHLTLIVDAAGMVVASSRNELVLSHTGPLADGQPDEATLRSVYVQQTLRALDIRRPRRPAHAEEWTFEGLPYLLTRAPLKNPEYRLLVLSPIDQLAALRPLHYAIGVLAALFGVLMALLGERRAEGSARRRHNQRTTAALNDRLKALNTDKDRYLGIAAHDLRNPLSSVRGLSELMLESPLDEAQQREFLETIHRTSNEMLGLVNDLLDTSVIESGKLTLKRTDQDLVKLVRQRIRHLEPHARSKQIAIDLDAAAGRASIDAAKFGQVIDNLVSNAVKFSPSGTTVGVALHCNGDGFTFAVQDQGPGIPEEDRKLMFRSFQKLSARPTGGEKSTGLGLAIVKRIVDAHGGRIDVDDAPGGGTRFTVTVPSAPDAGGLVA